MNRYAPLLRRLQNPSLALDAVRIYLGVALTIRGAMFLADSAMLLEFASRTDRDWFFPMALVHYVILAHIGGGLMLATGFLTRVAAALQIPVLLGAVFFVHLEEGLLTAGQSLELSSLVLFLLAVIVITGAGRLSFDYLLNRQGIREVYLEDENGERIPHLGHRRL